MSRPSTESVDWEKHVDVYSFEKEQRRFTIERRSKSTWVVGGSDRFVLDPEIIEFIYESFPSNRTEEFIKKTRFNTKEEAYRQLERYWETHERIGPVWRRKDSAPPLPEMEEIADEDDDE